MRSQEGADSSLCLMEPRLEPQNSQIRGHKAPMAQHSDVTDEKTKAQAASRGPASPLCAMGAMERLCSRQVRGGNVIDK